jgi:glutamine transport system ATP-binding protein
MLKVSHLSKIFQGKPILNDLNFEIGEGEIALILGGSGAGKSTLLRILNHLESYEAGSISFLNKNHAVGMVFQHFNLFEHLNVEENITYALTLCKKLPKKEARQIAAHLLCRYGLQDKRAFSVSQLSGGQKQRLAIARTLAMDPQVVCLDEPTSALDPNLTNQVAEFIRELALEKRTVILTTHDLGLIDQLDGHLFLMEGGLIVEKGSKKEMIAHPSLYPKLQAFLKGKVEGLPFVE